MPIVFAEVKDPGRAKNSFIIKWEIDELYFLQSQVSSVYPRWLSFQSKLVEYREVALISSGKDNVAN
jgi:hypothetical protein